MLSDDQRAQIAAACTALSVAYARHVDFGDYEAFVDLFTEDAILAAGPVREGREAIRASMAQRSPELRSRHVLTNIHIDVDGPDAARGISYLTLYRHIGPESLDDAAVPMRGPAAVGHYSDRFRLTPAGWKIAERRLSLAFADAAQFARR